MSDSALELNSVTKVFGRTKAVDGVSFSVRRGSITGLLGPNGSGKTTTIRMIMNIIMPDSGSISLFGGKNDFKAIESIAYLPEERGLFPSVKVKDTISYIASLRNARRSDAIARTVEFLREAHLEDAINKKMKELSKGMQQLVMLSGILAVPSKLAILDEPFIGLDPVNRENCINIIKRVNREGSTILLSTHLLDQAEKLCSEVNLLSKGKLVLSGPLPDIKLRSAKRSVLIKTLDGKRVPNSYEYVAMGINYQRVDLKDGQSPHQLLSDIVAQNIQVEQFQILIPTLEEIYINEVVKNSQV